MNKILTVGHPHSGYRDVERMFQSCGMSQARSSKREGLTPVEIGAILRKAHGEVSSEAVMNGDEINQIEAGAVWHGLALDLLMNNIDQKFWGWSDPEAIWLLDYWKALDPKMAFVLVYDEPHRVLTEAGCDEAKLFSREIVERRLDNWNAYNNALLGFYLRNRERSILVNATQVRQTAEACLNELKPWFDDHLLPSAHPHTNGTFRPVFARNGEERAAGGASKSLSVSALTVPALADGFLVESILAEYPEHLQRYEELQASATIPLPESTNNYPEPLEAWLIQMKRRSETGRVLSILAEGKHRAEEQLLVKEQELAAEQERHLFANRTNEYLVRENGALESWRYALEEEKRSLEEKLQEQRHQAGTLQEALSTEGKAKSELSEENTLLLSQLHQVQEELERIYLENEKSKKAIAEKTESEKRAKLLEEEKGSLERKLKDLQQQTGKLHEEVKSASKAKGEIEEENQLMLSQLHKVQEELERYYLENKKLRKQLSPPLYGAGDRLKSELPYRLGAAIIERSRNVWPMLFLPVSLSRIARDYRKQEKQQATDLPPLNKYRDYPEAERVQKHLSYRLGETWLKHSRTPWGWVAMPFALNKARREYLDHRKSSGK